MGKERGSAEKTIRTIRRKTRRQYSADEKIRIVMEGLRGEDTIKELSGEKGWLTASDEEKKVTSQHVFAELI